MARRLIVAPIILALSVAAVPAQQTGFVSAWGSNRYGQLGNGYILQSITPVSVSGLTGVVAISAGALHSLAVMSDGTVRSWGRNNSGQLGNGTAADASTPTRVSGLSGVVAVAAGLGHSLALENDGSVWAWGDNSLGQLGNGTTGKTAIPVRINGLTGVTAIAAGNEHSVALKSDGTAWAWGFNGVGELGNGTATNARTPVQVAGLSGVVKIAAGDDHSLALNSDGAVWAWGQGISGQLGDGTTNNRNTAVQVVGLSGVVAITAGSAHSLALKSDGTVWSWGYNQSGQLGNGTLMNSATPGQVSGLAGVTAIGGRHDYCLALKGDGTIWAWGPDVSGPSVNGSFTRKLTTPTLVGGLTDVAAATAGGDYGLALKRDGTVLAWGYNGYGELGNGTSMFAVKPVPINGLAGVAMVAAGYNHSLALNSDGTVRAWGDNTVGQLGTATTTASGTPVPVSGLSGVVAIAAGTYHSLALKNDGTVRAWGWNTYGQLGNGTSSATTIPVEVSGLGGVTAVAAGHYHSLALKNDGTVWAWGWNDYGQLGTGTATATTRPVQVVGLTGVVAIVAGYHHSLAVRSDGTVWAWGANTNGELGNGTTTNASSPVQVSGLTGVAAVAAGEAHSLAVKRDGAVWSWGSNSFGTLGNGTTANASTPVQVSALTNVVAAAAGGSHSLAVKRDGTVWSWGANTLGNETTAGSSTPVQVGGLTGITSVSAGEFHSIALQASSAPSGLRIDTASPLPQGTAGTAYNQALSATGGVSPYTWSVTSGTLPGGITLSSGGVLSGTPASAGTFTFTVQVKDSAAATASATFSLTLAPAVSCTYSISPASLSIGAAGGSGSTTVSAGASCSWTASSPLSWVTITGGASGKGSGTVTAQVAANTGASSRTGTVTVASQAWTITQAAAAGGGSPVVDQVNLPPWTNGWTNIQYVNKTSQSFVPAMPLLTAVEVDLITANPYPEWPGDTIILTILAGSQVLATVSRYEPSGFNGLLRFDMPSGGVPVTPGQTYVIQLQEQDLILFGWKLGVDTYPKGTAIFNGYARPYGDHFFRTYGSGSGAGPVPVSVATASPLPPGTVGTSYSQALSATGGTSPYTWSVTSGSLPGGLALSDAGVLSGTPAAEGTFNFAVQVRDTVSATASKTFSLAVSRPVSSAPAISAGGILNAASNASGQAIAAGSLVSIYGQNLASSTVSASSVPLPTTLGGATVTFNDIPAPLHFVSPGQINVQVPWNVLASGESGNVRVVLISNGVASPPATAVIGPFSPGIFAVNYGAGSAIAINADGSLAAPSGSIPGVACHPAKAGDPGGLIILATGLGALDSYPASGTNSADKLRKNVATPEVLVGGVPATVLFSGASPQFVGVNQINIRIPAEAPFGDNVPLQLRSGGITTTDRVTIAVGRCCDPLAVTPSDSLKASGQAGQLSLSSYSIAYTLHNNLAVSVPFTAVSPADWVTVSRASGTLGPHEETSVTVSLNSKANLLPVGSYTATVTFADNLFGTTVTRSVSLDLSATGACVNIAGQWFGSEKGTLTCTVTVNGESATETDPVNGSDLITITQQGCQVSYTSASIMAAFGAGQSLRQGQVEGNSVKFTGIMGQLAAGFTYQQNLVDSSGTVTGNVINLASSGVLKASGMWQGVSTTFSCTATTSSTLARWQ